jgi:hypothetical protein
MAASIYTRKPIDSLTIEDLENFAIWEFCTDEEEVEGQDETWVRPLRGKSIPHGMYSLNVAAEFTTSGGVEFCGFVGVTTLDRKIEISGGVILNGRKPYLFIPNPEFFLFEKAKKDLAKGLGIKSSELFPIKYTLSLKVDGEKKFRSGDL